MANTLTPLLELARLLGSNAALEKHVRLGHEDPRAYFEKHQEELVERGLDAPVSDSGWLALVDGLRRQKLLLEIDWKEHPSDIVDGLKRLKPARRARQAFNEGSEPGIATTKFLERLTKRLAQYGLALAALDIEGDSYALVLLPADQRARAMALAKRAGYRIAYPPTAPVKIERAHKLFEAHKSEASALPAAALAKWKSLLAQVGDAPPATSKFVDATGVMKELPWALSNYVGIDRKPDETLERWQAVIGWAPNFMPRAPTARAQIDRAILTTRRLSLIKYTGSSRRNFADLLLGNVKAVEWQASPLSGIGWLVITTRGTKHGQRVVVLCTPDFAQHVDRVWRRGKAIK